MNSIMMVIILIMLAVSIIFVMCAVNYEDFLRYCQERKKEVDRD